MTPIPTPALTGPAIDIAGWLEKLGNPFKWIAPEEIFIIVSKGVTLVIMIAGLLFLAWFIWGAIEWLTSGGEPESLKKAQARLTNALIGLVLVLASWAIFMIVNNIFGIPFWKEEEIGPRDICPGSIDCCTITKITCCNTPGRRITGDRCQAVEKECYYPDYFDCILPSE